MNRPSSWTNSKRCCPNAAAYHKTRGRRTLRRKAKMELRNGRIPEPLQLGHCGHNDSYDVT
jgi:hypothetical protein